MFDQLRLLSAPLVSGLAALLAACGAAETEGRPNLLLISIDTLHAGHLGLYGYDRPTSPELDAFAETAVVFDAAQASASWTLPGMASIFTSVYSSTHGCWNYGSRLDDSFTTLPEILLAHGYDTACAVSHIYCTTRSGIQQGFVHFDDSFAQAEEAPELATTSPKIADEGIAYLEAKSGARDGHPWFLWLHFFDPHETYIPQAGFTERFLTEGADRAQELVDLYDGEVAFTDHHIGRVLDALERTGFADDTIVAVIADHGEEFGEHGGLGHGHTLFGELVRVPFVVRVPGIEPGRVRATVRTIDLMPTLLDLAGLPAHAQADGRSLIPAMRGEPFTVEPALAEVRSNPANEIESVHDGRYKLVHSLEDGSYSLYDLDEDPTESADLSAERPEEVERLIAVLGELRFLAEEKGRQYDVSPDVPLAPEMIEALQGLGYVGEEGEPLDPDGGER